MVNVNLLMCTIMKKSYYLLGFLPLFYSCSEIEDLPNVESSVSNVTTRAAGDGVYDVLPMTTWVKIQQG